MKATEMLNKIKTFLGEETTDIVENIQEKVELATAKLENGTVLEAEAFEAGKEIFIVTDDEKVALPVGEYMMEDGKSLIIEDEGIIAEIKDLEEEEAPAVEEEEAKEDLGYATREELAEAVSEIKAMIEDLKKDKEEMSEEVEDKVEETELSKDLQEQLSEPAAEPITHNPEKTNNFNVKFAQNRKQTTLDKVLSKINN
jgi:flagellar biosynthesis/type III secretory pathway chaperone